MSRWGTGGRSEAKQSTPSVAFIVAIGIHRLKAIYTMNTTALDRRAAWSRVLQIRRCSDRFNENRKNEFEVIRVVTVSAGTGRLRQ